MTRILLAAAVLGTGAAITVATIPIFRPSVRAGSQASFIDAGMEQHQQKSPTIKQRLLHARELEDALYKILERDREFNDPRWPFVIKVRDVQGKSLIDATFKHRRKGNVNEYDAIIQARRAVLRFDLDAKVVRVFLEHSEVQHFGRDADVVLINSDTLVIPIPPTDLLMPLRTAPQVAEIMSKDRIVMVDSDLTLSLDYSRDGKTLATAGFDGVVHLWDMIEAKEVARLKGEKSTIRSVSFAPDGKTVACVNDAGFVELWDATTGTLKQTLPGLSESMRQAARNIMLDAISFAPAGHLLAVSGFGPINAELSDRIYELRVFDARSGQPKWSHIGRGEQACSLAFAADGKTLVYCDDAVVGVIEVETGKLKRTLTKTTLTPRKS